MIQCFCATRTVLDLQPTNFVPTTVAVAEVNECLESFIKEIVRGKNVANISKLAYHGIQSGAGEKGGKPKPKRR